MNLLRAPRHAVPVFSPGRARRRRRPGAAPRAAITGATRVTAALRPGPRSTPEFSTCKLGKLQSPIDIRGAKAADLPAIKFDYKPSPLKVIDNGHTIQVNYAPGSSIDVGGTRYELVQFHFHRPSEEKINGKAHAMVAHLVHKSADGKLAVVAVLLDKGGANPTDRHHLEEPAEGKEKEAASPTPPSTPRRCCPRDQRLLHLPGLARPRRRAARASRWFVLKTPLKIADARDRGVRQDSIRTTPGPRKLPPWPPRPDDELDGAEGVGSSALLGGIWIAAFATAAQAQQQPPPLTVAGRAHPGSSPTACSA